MIEMTFQIIESAKQLSPKLGYILGVCKGDGHITKRNHAIILRVKDKDFALEFKNVLEKWSGIKAHLYEKIATGGYGKGNVMFSTELNSKNACLFLRNFDLNQLLTADDSVKAELVRGFFDSDGYIYFSNEGNGYKYEHIGLVNKKIELIKFVEKMLNQLGIKTAIYRKPDDSFHLMVRGNKSARMFRDKIGSSLKRKRDRLNRIPTRKKKRVYKKEEFDKVMKLKKLGHRMPKIAKITGVSYDTVCQWIVGKYHSNWR